MSYKMLSNNYAQEFLITRQASCSLLQKYAAYQALFKRACSELSQDFHAEFTSLFSRLQAIGREFHFNIRHIDAFRRHAHAILNLQEKPTTHGLQEDEYALALFINHFSTTGIPLNLLQQCAATSTPHSHTPTERIMRVNVEAVHTDHLLVHSARNSEPAQRVALNDFPEMSTWLSPGTTLNLIDAIADEEQNLHPLYIIYEPDFLIDVTSLTACLQPYGHHPYNYLINKFRPRTTHTPQLLGDATNQFVDTCLHHTDTPNQHLFEEAIQNAFHNNILGYLSCSTQVNAKFFNEAHQHFDHIAETLNNTFRQADIHIDTAHLLLEPSFVCPALGLRGRLDMMSDDHTCIIELKSGKIDEYNHRPRRTHVLQMALYKEIVHYNLNLSRTKIRTFLLYSKYPYLYDERVSTQELRNLMTLRNQIVYQEQNIRKGLWPQIQSHMSIDVINTNKLDGKLFHQYLKPELEAIITPLQQSGTPVGHYFSAFFSFISREQFIAKTGDNRPDSNRGFANVWNTDYTTRKDNGDIIAPLQLKSILNQDDTIRIIFSFTRNTAILPNFNIGEMVQLYPITRTGEAPNVQQTETIRAILVDLTKDSLTLILNSTQRSAHFFTDLRPYAIEHDYTDATFNTCYRGLFRLLTAPARRQALFMNLRQPERDERLTLTRSYGSETTDQILLRAKQASDFYLLSGPPGCGKTSIMLRAMVEEFVASYPDENLLLTAYTNRAVDEICAMLKDITPVPEFIRLGNRWATAPQYHSDLLEEKFKPLRRRQDIRQRLEQTHIIVGTVATIGGNADLFQLKHFRTAIVDEASQLLEPQLAPLLFGQHRNGNSAIDKFIFIGDEKQLPAVVSQPEKDCVTRDSVLKEIGIENLGHSLFQRLLRQVKRDHQESFFGQVRTQGRMHPDISRFANRYFYAGALSAVPLPHQTEALGLHSNTDTPLHNFLARQRTGFIDITPPSPTSHSYKANPSEAHALLRVVSALLQVYHDSGKDLKPNQIGIIVPFRNQIALVRSLFGLHPELQDITIDTVECYQGSQREIILFGTTISRPYQLELLSNLQQIDGMLIDRKLNVALTRARRQCFMFGQKELLQQNPIYAHYIKEHPVFTLR